jgi:hypothetical protein
MKKIVQLTEKESLDIIQSMIQKAKLNYHDRGISSLLWGSVVTIASLVSYLQVEFKFKIGFDIWLIVLFAIIPQIIISTKERKNTQVKNYEDEAIDTIWWVYGITILCLTFYQNIIPYSSQNLINSEGWQLAKHYIDSSKPDEVIKPFTPSIYSLYILIYALPTMVTGITKKFKPMIIGSIICYVMFVISCFTASKYDQLCGAIAAIFCWLIPGVILRKKYLKNRVSNV